MESPIKISNFQFPVSKYKLHLLIFVLSLLILTKFNFDPDLGWHLAFGNKFLETGKIIRSDQFSWTMPGYHWGNSYFLYQVLVAFVFKNLGYTALVFFFGLLSSFGILILALGKRLNFWKALVISLGAGVAAANLGVRPHTVSFLFFTVLLVLLERGFLNKIVYLPFWFFFFMVWANFHRGFFVGLLVFVMYLAVDFFRQRKLKKNPKILLLALPLLAALLGTLVTPFHINLYKSAVIFDLTSWHNLYTIAEWLPTAVFSPINFLFTLSGAVFVYIFIRSSKNFQKKDLSWFLLAAFLFAFAFLAAAFIFFWSAVFIFLTIRHFDFKLKLADFWTKILFGATVASVFLIIFLSFLVSFLESLDFQKVLVKDKYPVTAVKFLKNKGITKGIFNAYEWGGFLAWQFPEGKVFIDGRMASWKKQDGTSILADYLEILNGNCQLVESYDIKVALLQKKSKAPCFKNWQKVFEDDISKILIRPNICYPTRYN